MVIHRRVRVGGPGNRAGPHQQGGHAQVLGRAQVAQAVFHQEAIAGRRADDVEQRRVSAGAGLIFKSHGADIDNAVEVIGDALVLTMMRFADELADLADFTFPAASGIRKQELTMARQLVDNLSADWDPEKYTDEYIENLMRVIQAKLKGRKPRLTGREAPQRADVVDLMARLRASLESRGAAETSRRGSASKRKGRTRAAKRARVA